MPAEGWPVELSSGAVDPIGALTAAITLRAADGGDPLPGVVLDFNQEVPEEGAIGATLKVNGLESLRPGDYQGEITLSASTPSGLPMDVEIRPGPLLPVTLSVPRPLARITEPSVDFGSVQYETSPNFRLNQSAEIPLNFVGKPFDVLATLESTQCENLTVASNELRQRDGQFFLPLTLTSDGPILPDTCVGTLALAGPDGDYDVLPSSIEWRTRVDEVEWSLAGSDLNLGDLQDAGAGAAGTLLLRFNGKTPFVVKMESIEASGDTGDGVVALSAAELEMPPVEVTGEPNEAGLYEVPIALVARSVIPNDPFRGSFYSGDLAVSIAGLPGDVERAAFSFRSPSVVQRYVLPIVVPIYGLPMGLLTIPLTLLLLLVLLARIRGRDIDDDEIEEAAMAAAMQMNVAPSQAAAASAPQPFVPVTAPSPEQVWGTSEWGLPWQGGGDGQPSASRPPADAGDPWNASW